MPAGRIVDVDDLASLDAHLASGATSMRGWRLQDLDLRERERALLALEPAGAVLLGCDLSDAAEGELVARGAVVFQDVPGVPLDAYRSSLYPPAELLGDGSRPYRQSLDARIYAWSRARSLDVADTTAAALHDHAIGVALEAWATGRGIVGVMGGHAMRRGTADYEQAARLGRSVARAGLTVATGGGPGAMEAANLGARAATSADAALEAALEIVATVPTFDPSIDRWVATGLEAAALLGTGTETLGVPTWHYGHEPPNALQSVSAKYCSNAVREEVLLRLSTAGLVVLPGAGGTVQEIFQDACENYYADDASWAPLVLVGTRYWTETLPAWPLLAALMAGKPAAAGLALVDTVDEALAALDVRGPRGDRASGCAS